MDALGQLRVLEEALQKSGLWDDPSNAAELLRKQETLREALDRYGELEKRHKDCLELWELARGEDVLREEVESMVRSLGREITRYRLELLFVRPEDRHACFLSVQAGSGGTEAQDWAAMLLRMYTRFAEGRGYGVELLEDSPGEEAGLKSATMKVSGKNFPYGWLKGETGVHRLVRISPFDANARRHTSFASVSVIPELDDTFLVEIQEKDLRIDTYRASGAGGQHVNKTDSAVRITHIPTGIVVQCQNDRSQHRNRATAMAMLKSKLHERERAKQEEAASKNREEERGITWGQQIRSYVLQPYQLVKDVRTQVEIGNTGGVLNGDIEPFLVAYLQQRSL